MEIYPLAQLHLYVLALLLGALQGAIWELFVAVRILLGAYCPTIKLCALYERRLPLLSCGVSFPKPQRRRVWRFLIEFIGDVLFCVSFSCSLILLLYAYHDGAWRLAVLLLAFVGFAVFRVTLARVLARISAYLAYALAALGVYCHHGAAYVQGVIAKVCKRFLFAPCRHLRRMLLARHSKALCLVQLQQAAQGLQATVLRKDGKDVKTKKGKATPAVGDLHSDRGDLLRGAFDLCQSADGVESAAKRKRRAGTAKRRA